MNIPPDFWAPDPSGYQAKKHIESPPAPEMIASVEAELGYKLPASYTQLMDCNMKAILKVMMKRSESHARP